MYLISFCHFYDKQWQPKAISITQLEISFHKKLSFLNQRNKNLYARSETCGCKKTPNFSLIIDEQICS